MKVLKKKSHWRYSKLVNLSVLFILLYTNINAQFINESFEKTVDLPANTEINLETRYDVHYKTWDKNQLKVIFNINFEAKNAKMIKPFYSRIENSVNQALDNINTGRIKIFIPYDVFMISNKTTIIQLLNNKDTYYFKSFHISMTVYAPKYNNLKLKTASASVRIEDLEANADINIVHQLDNDSLYIGKCKNLKLNAELCDNMEIGTVENAKITLQSSKLHNIGKIKNTLILNSEFSSFSVGSVINADVVLESSTLEIDKVQNMALDASFSQNIRIDDVVNLNIKKLNSSKIKNQKLSSLKVRFLDFSNLNLKEISTCAIEYSNSSKIYIDKINNIKIEDASFSSVKINELTKTLVCNSESGDIAVGKVSKDFKKIKVYGRFVNINMNLGSCSYKFSADLIYPNLVIERKRFKGHERLNMVFMVGKEPNSEVSFDCNNCKIRID